MKGDRLGAINNELDQATETAKNGLSKTLIFGGTRLPFIDKILYQGIQLSELEDKSVNLKEHVRFVAIIFDRLSCLKTVLAV